MAWDALNLSEASAEKTIRADGDKILIPDAHLLFTGDYSRAHSDLIITGKDGGSLLIEDYFAADKPADLVAAAGGAKPTGEIVTILAGPEFPGQYAQAGGVATPASRSAR